MGQLAILIASVIMTTAAAGAQETSNEFLFFNPPAQTKYTDVTNAEAMLVMTALMAREQDLWNELNCTDPNNCSTTLEDKYRRVVEIIQNARTP